MLNGRFRHCSTGYSQSYSKQKGLSYLGWLILLSVCGFFLLLTFRLGPVYLDDRFVSETLKTLGQDPAFPGMTVGEIRSKMGKTFTINNIRGKAVQAVKVKKTSKKTLVSIEYEERIPVLANADVVLSFNHVLDSTKPDECCKPK